MFISVVDSSLTFDDGSAVQSQPNQGAPSALTDSHRPSPAYMMAALIPEPGYVPFSFAQHASAAQQSQSSNPKTPSSRKRNISYVSSSHVSSSFNTPSGLGELPVELFMGTASYLGSESFPSLARLTRRTHTILD
jgi:hypothetical protein